MGISDDHRVFKKWYLQNCKKKNLDYLCLTDQCFWFQKNTPPPRPLEGKEPDVSEGEGDKFIYIYIDICTCIDTGTTATHCILQEGVWEVTHYM